MESRVDGGAVLRPAYEKRMMVSIGVIRVGKFVYIVSG